MAWSYSFIEISDAEKHARRLSLDSYGLYAQLSTLVPVAVALIVRLAVWLSTREAPRSIAYDVVPTSPGAKYIRESTASGSMARVWRRIAWYLEDDVYFAGVSWGRRDQLIFGGLWALWLVFLCFIGTGHGTWKNRAVGSAPPYPFFPTAHLAHRETVNISNRLQPLDQEVCRHCVFSIPHPVPAVFEVPESCRLCLPLFP